MPNIQKVNVDGQEHSAIEQSFVIVSEQWDEYDLADGGRIRMKTTPIKIFKIVDSDGNPLYDSEGELQFFVRHTTTVTSSL